MCHQPNTENSCLIGAATAASTAVTAAGGLLLAEEVELQLQAAVAGAGAPWLL